MPTSNTPTKLRNFADLPPVEVVPDANLQVYVDLAWLIRSEDLEGKGLSSDRLDSIELFLSAHYAILTYEKGGLTQQMVGQSEDRYQLIGQKMYGLSATRFGQAAVSLDTSGTLVKLTTPPLKALFRVVGDPTSSDYWNQ